MKYMRNVVAFVKTVHEGSFTAAAAALSVTPAAVSKSVQNLERGGGSPAQPLNAAARADGEGGVFYAHCRSAMLELENATSAVAEGHREPTGVLRITSAAMFGRRHLLRLLTEFTARFPGVTLDFVLEDRVVDLILDGYDVCVRADVPPTGNLVSKRIVPIQAIVCGSPAYFDRHPVPRRPEDLLSSPARSVATTSIVPAISPPARASFQERRERYRRSLRRALRSRSRPRISRPVATRCRPSHSESEPNGGDNGRRIHRQLSGQCAQ